MLVDTSGWYCALDEHDERHKAARTVVTHSYIISELVALCHRRRVSRRRMLEFLSELLEDRKTEIIWTDERLTKVAFDLLKARDDKDWSLVTP